ncbi:hypothetical protein EZV62_000219 [Acer yangbiense]|uniref:Uncharacterized protein n=1 Tax=Acer yangbiense TaxID=1000413 RepID=A0A5C7IQN8_9ROSI|nr:hypothetical protein EZV62_000219 [Acer yangbiense]
MALGRDVLMQRSTVEKQRKKKLGEEEQAAVLLMALSYGSVYAYDCDYAVSMQRLWDQKQEEEKSHSGYKQRREKTQKILQVTATATTAVKSHS